MGGPMPAFDSEIVKPFLVAGAWRTGSASFEVHFPFSGELVARVAQAGVTDMDDAMAAAVRGFEITRRLPAHRREAILRSLAEQMEMRGEELIGALILEGGKTRKVARGELARARQTVLAAAEEAKRIGGEIVPLDWTPDGENRFAVNRRFPLGPILAIAPFNYPLNLACHKVAPAIAAGNSLVLKPASATPLSALLLGEMILAAGYPPEALSVLPCAGKDADRLVTDDRFKMITFTGSSEVGWGLKARSGRKRIALELGGNAAAIVHEDADLDYAVKRIANGGFVNAGQNCISVQRVLAHRPIYRALVDRLLAAVADLKTGDPRDELVDVGPMISESAAIRAEAWVNEAVAQGAHLLVGGTRQGAVLAPTVVTDVDPSMSLGCQEVFAPVLAVMVYDTFEQALGLANSTDYGLQSGVFTNDIGRIMQAYETIEVGGLMINDVSTFRVDHMPYGGVKNSGIGREGVRYAVEEMTEQKLMVINLNR
jgi:acyl-CoA reductase-like NAD-dependent aldehyde dehydrogenase